MNKRKVSFGPSSWPGIWSPTKSGWTPIWIDAWSAILYWLLRTSVLERASLALSSPASFSWSGGSQPSIEEGNRSPPQEKTRRYGQQTIRKGMHRLQERSTKDFFSHDTPAGWTSSTICPLAHVILFQAAQR